MASQFAFRSHFACHARHFPRECVQLVHHRVDGVLQLQNFALHVHRDLARQIAARHRRSHLGNVAHLRRQVSGHRVDRIRQVLPGARNAGNHRLPAKLSVGSHFARHARHFGSERTELIYHRVDRFFELQNFSAYVHRNLARQIAAGHRRGHFRDVAHLARQVAGHQVHVVRQILPRSRDARHFRLAAQFSFGPYFARHARHFRREHAQLLNHRVHDVRQTQKFSLQRTPVHIQAYRLGQIALRHCGDRPRHLRGGAQQIVNERVDGTFHLAPGAARLVESRALFCAAFLADHLANTRQFVRHALVCDHDFVEGVRDLPADTGPYSRQAHRKVAIAHGLKTGQNRAQLRLCHFGGRGVPVSFIVRDRVRWGGRRRGTALLRSFHAATPGPGLTVSRQLDGSELPARRCRIKSLGRLEKSTHE